MDPFDRGLIIDAIEALTAQVKRIADRLEARDKAEDKRREDAEILRERIEEAESRRAHQQRYAP